MLCSFSSAQSSLDKPRKLPSATKSSRKQGHHKNSDNARSQTVILFTSCDIQDLLYAWFEMLERTFWCNQFSSRSSAAKVQLDLWNTAAAVLSDLASIGFLYCCACLLPNLVSQLDFGYKHTSIFPHHSQKYRSSHLQTVSLDGSSDVLCNKLSGAVRLLLNHNPFRPTSWKPLSYRFPVISHNGLWTLCSLCADGESNRERYSYVYFW